MANQSLECGQVDLAALLVEGGALVDHDSTLGHLGSCPECQRRLEALAASDEWWQDCQTHLGSSESKGPDLTDTLEPHFAEHTDDAGIDSDEAELLSPPSHPEMLGRIGRYEVEKLLGRGGMGVVFKAFDSELHRPVAIKVLASHLAGSGAARQRFGREARATAAVVHEHVVSIHDVAVSAKPPYLVMQYVPGESLQTYVDRQGPLEAGDVARIGHQIAAGLAAAHAQGLIHRDIKPGNIMLENGLGRVVITDFGLARAADDASLTHSGIVAGTPHYMSPEQARGEQADARCDLFSMGAVMYFMATGHPPFRAEQAMAVLHRICHDRHRPLFQIRPNIPDELASVIDRLLEKKPSRRFDSANQVHKALAGVLSDMQQPRRRQPQRWLRQLKNKRGQVLSVTIGLLLVALTMVWISGWQQPAPVISNATTKPSSSQPAVSTASLAEAERTEVTGQLPDFTNEAGAIQQSLQTIENRPFPETTMLRSFDDPWIAELSSAIEAVTALEGTWPSGTDSPLHFNSSIGEKR
jgi:serine/threonine protein kinase